MIFVEIKERNVEVVRCLCRKPMTSAAVTLKVIPVAMFKKYMTLQTNNGNTKVLTALHPKSNMLQFDIQKLTLM